MNLFARNLDMNIKVGKTADFTRVLRDEVLPVLKKQKGFKDEFALVNGGHCIAISLWDGRPNAEAYQAGAYPQVLQKLTPFIDGTPRLDTFEVSLSTLTPA